MSTSIVSTCFFWWLHNLSNLDNLASETLLPKKMSILVWFLLMMFLRIPQFPEGSSGRTDHWKKFFCMEGKKPFPYSRMHGNIYLHWMLHVWSSDEKSKYTSINIQIPWTLRGRWRSSQMLHGIGKFTYKFGSNLCLKCRLRNSIQSMEHLGWRFCGIRWHPSWKVH